MGLWDSLKQHAGAQFLDVIQWLDDTRDTLVFRFPIFNQAIQDGAKLVVREGQAAVFVSEGKMSEVFGPGTYELSTRTPAIWGFFQSIKYGLNYPYKGDIYFVSTRVFTGQKWGTPNPILLRDKDFGAVRIRAFGVFAYRIKDQALFLREVVGTAGLYTTDEISGQLKRKLVSVLADSIGESKIPVMDLASQYHDLGEALRTRVGAGVLTSYGVEITEFVVENISVPEEVEKMIDKRSSMGALGDLNAYTQFQAAQAIGNVGQGGAGHPSPFMDAGVGLAMGQALGGAFARAGVGTPGGAPPPPPPTEVRYHYNGPSGTAELTAREVAARVGAARTATHNVWAAGWPAWRGALEIPEIASLVPPAPPPPPSAGATFHYTGADNVATQLSAGDIAARVRADAGGRHLVWREGMAVWTAAAQVPEIAALLNGGPPPLPPTGGPPPLP
jgi:membrane protease subunit (stomatin/prohibitin family)